MSKDFGFSIRVVVVTVIVVSIGASGTFGVTIFGIDFILINGIISGISTTSIIGVSTGTTISGISIGIISSEAGSGGGGGSCGGLFVLKGIERPPRCGFA